MVWLSRSFDWRPALRIVTPETFTRWHRQGFRLFWRWKSKPGRPKLPKDVRALIQRMALDKRIGETKVILAPHPLPAFRKPAVPEAAAPTNL
jgi:hypothetical protein